MSTGTGVFHSEKNGGEEILCLFRTQILPDRSGYTPQHGEARILWEARENRLLHTVSGRENTAYMKIHQDMDIYVSALFSRRKLDTPVEPSRQVCLVVVEGEVGCNGVCLQLCDVVEADESFCTKTSQGIHIALLDMAREVYFQEWYELHRVEEIRFQGCRYRSTV